MDDILVLVKKSNRTISLPAVPDSEEENQIADLAFALWLAGGFRELSPQQALFKAHREIKGGLKVITRNKRVGLFVASRFVVHEHVPALLDLGSDPDLPYGAA
ncbi:MAG: hypothetical protein U0Q18_24960 [Bryobacteraceae bacterium]